MTAPPIVFLDFDGVIRFLNFEADGKPPFFCTDRMQMLAGCCVTTGAKVVVSSDLRLKMSEVDIRSELAKGLLGPLLHDDWRTGERCAYRWQEIEHWLRGHPEVTHYAILDDQVVHFKGAPEEMGERLLLCTNRFGFVNKLCLPLVTFLGGSGLTKGMEDSTQVDHE